MSATSSSTTRHAPTAPADAARGPLAGRHAVVTGAGRGIGAAIATELARLGADLTLLGRGAAALRERQERLSNESGRAVHVGLADVTDETAVAHAFHDADEVLGPVTILVNNAGDAESAPFTRTTRELWERMLAVNVTGAFLCSRQMLPGALATGWGRVVNVASTAGLKGYPYASAYCASKHALVGLTRALAAEVATSGVTVNAVCPGYTDTDLVARSVARIVAKTGRDERAALSALLRENPQGRLIAPDEIAASVGWLCLPSSSSITGQTIAISGGEHA